MNKSIIEYSFRLPLETRQIKHIVITIQQAAHLLKLDKEIICDKIPLILDEALRNCIVHGNKCKNNKEVVLRVSLNSNSIILNFKDEGKGFDYKKVLESLAENEIISLDICKGRGILLLSKLSDKLCYSNKGRDLEIVIYF